MEIVNSISDSCITGYPIAIVYFINIQKYNFAKFKMSWHLAHGGIYTSFIIFRNIYVQNILYIKKGLIYNVLHLIVNIWNYINIFKIIKMIVSLDYLLLVFIIEKKHLQFPKL